MARGGDISLKERAVLHSRSFERRRKIHNRRQQIQKILAHVSFVCALHAWLHDKDVRRP